MAARKGGFYCVVRGCPSKTGEGISLFSIPTDRSRAELWLKAANRYDLLSKGAELHTNYRICEKHFEPVYMYKGNTRKYLFQQAHPTIFSHSQYSKHTDEPLKKVIRLEGTTETYNVQEVIINSPTDKNHNNIPDTLMEEFLVTDVNRQEVSSPPRPHTPAPFFTAATQTPSKLSGGTPRKRKLRLKIKKLRASAKKAYASSKQKEDHKSLKIFFQMCDKFLNKSLAQIVKAQAILKTKCPKSRRYSDEYKQFALTLYFLGPRAYAFMERILYLPSKRSLQKITENLVCKPGLNNDQIFDALTLKVNTMLDQDKHCSICIDEMSIKSNLFFDTGRDEIVGLYDIGNGKKESIIAQNVLVIMVRGLYSNWKQQLAYFFINTTFEANHLLPIIKECISKLFQSGLYVNCLVTDMGSNFLKLSKLLGISPTNSEFDVNGQKIIYIFDPCHLIKATRNNLINNVFYFDDKKTSWSFIETFYHEDKKQFYKCAPKLTHSHIYPTSFEKMRVKLASQILSNTVASSMYTYISLGILPSDALGTIEIIEKFNNLFDILNSTDNNNPNKFKNVFEGTDFQINYLDSMIDLVHKLKILDKTGKDVTCRSRSKKCWIVTMNGVKKLWDNLKSHDFKYLK
ncbi:unnamed protein product, partial [Diabrotica balteata]